MQPPHGRARGEEPAPTKTVGKPLVLGDLNGKTWSGECMALKRVKNPESLDAIDIAFARAADSDEARTLLGKQARLIDSQDTLARADLRHRGWQIIGERVGALLKAMTVAVGMLALFLVGNFLWSAHKASGMVMDPFSVPPTMDRQGLTGSVVAQQLLDKIAALERGTQSARASSSYENSWSDSKGVAVPYTGVSLGELRREAREWLGSERHLSGEVVQLPGGKVAISFRSGPSSGRVEGSGADFNKLLDQAALLVFQETQLYRYAIWLSRHGGTTEQLRDLFTKLSRSDDPRERLWGLHGLANSVAANDSESVAIYARALETDATFLSAIGNLPYYAQRAGYDEKAYRGSTKSGAAYMAGQFDYTPSHSMSYGLLAQSSVADYQGDLLRAAQLTSNSVRYKADDVNTALRPFIAASAWAKAHDFPTAQDELAAAGYLDPARRAKLEEMFGKQDSVRLMLATATDDHAARAAEYVALIDHYMRAAAAAPDKVVGQSAIYSAEYYRPDAALAFARTGRLREATAIIAPLPSTHDGAFRARAFIAALGRDPAADQLFSEAVRRTPSLPAAHVLWAEAKARTGDYVAANTHAETAAKIGPKAADNYLWWGRALLALRRPAEAAEKFALAAKNAPTWGRARLDWAEALWLAGDRGAAATQLKEASTRTLSEPDRAQLRRMIASAKRQLEKRS